MPSAPSVVKIKRSKASAPAADTKTKEQVLLEERALAIDIAAGKYLPEESVADRAPMPVLGHLGKYVEEPYEVIASYFQGKHLERLVRHQIESYNHFINYQIQRTIQMFNPVIVHSENDYIEALDKYMLDVQNSFHNFKLYPPVIHENNGATKPMMPCEAKLRNFTYASTMTVDIKIDFHVRQPTADNPDAIRTVTKTLPKINIGKMPIMLKSSICSMSEPSFVEPASLGECPLDCGGYFIIKGSEKTVLGQERAAENRVYCFDGKNTTKWSWFAEIKSIPDFKCISPKHIEMMVASKNNGFGHPLFVTIPRVKQPIELFVVFRALGVLSDQEICQYILLDLDDPQSRDLLPLLQASVIEANKYMTKADALRHITASVAYTPINMDKEKGAKKKHDFTVDVLNNDLFPHCKSAKQKLFLLGYMAKKLLLTSIKVLPPDDRDSYLNKRIELTGTLLNNLFRNYFNKLVKEMQKQIVREINNGSWRSTDDYENIVNMTNIYKIMKTTTIENGINRALSTGDFSIKQSNSSKVGVAQVLNRLTYVSSLSHLRRINTPLEKSGELIPPRKLHNTTWGFLCCLTGDAEVLMDDRMDTKPIRDIQDGDWVNTVNRTTLQDQPSTMHNWFCKMPEELYKLTTASGRTIKATDDHPFLVEVERGTFKMKKLSELAVGDYVVIRHTVLPLPDSAPTLFVNAADVAEEYRDKLAPLLDAPWSVWQMKSLARLVGAVNHSDDGTKAIILVSDPCDTEQIVADVRALFAMEAIHTHRNPDGTQQVYVQGAAAHLLDVLGIRHHRVPEWIMQAGVSVQREFLGAYRTARKHALSHIHGMEQVDLYEPTVDRPETLGQLVALFEGLGIHVKSTSSGLVFDQDDANLNRYFDLIPYTYCDAMRQHAAYVLEMIKLRAYAVRGPIDTLYIPRNGCMSVPVLSIEEIPPEPVYDFTTYSENHSFVANSFVVSNCAETPEGQSIGIVKNISYMTHITIPTMSTSLYDYIYPQIRCMDDEDLTPADLSGTYLVKVFINGAWVGVTDKPTELYEDIKQKKYQGIINIYTSVIFDYKMMEIRVCNDGGRLARPVLRVKDNRALLTLDIVDRLKRKELTWNDLLTNAVLPESVIEYIDPEEQNYAMIAMRVKHKLAQDYDAIIRYTHCEIHPSTMFGILASCIPFPEHNQSPRNCYQCLSRHEVVCYADGRVRAIEDVKVGDAVLTFDPTTLHVSATTVVGQFVQRSQQPVFKINLINGASIVATADHQFMTDDGWMTVTTMMENTKHNLPVRVGVSDQFQYNHSMEDETNELPDDTRITEARLERLNVLVEEGLASYHKNTYFVPVMYFERQPEQYVSCIETESDNHSFITSHGILSKNCCMAKQAIGVYSLNFDMRMDKTAYVLSYPSRPLVDTRVMNFIQLDKVPSGHQVHVAIMSYTGYNQEDSILMNKGSLDRGLFAATIYHTEKDEDKNIIRDEIIRCKPDATKTKGVKFGNYGKLQADGFMPENTLAENRDIIIAKIVPIKENRNDPTKVIKYEDQSRTFRTTEESYIDKNYTGRNGDGYNFAKVRVRTWRKPVIGDKFASRSGQKGTCGLIVPEADMPFTKNGLRPDIILNPHAIPSRMTIAQLKETILGKVLIELGMFGDGTSFGDLDVKTIISELQRLGYESYGNELLYNGMTGEQIETSIFIGPVFYQRLKHMVNDKQHSRSIGPMVNLTRQPAEGRSRDGGFRIGEMERDVMVAHGASRFCRERLYDVSDKYTVHVCDKCGMVASYNDDTTNRMHTKSGMVVHLCKTCDNMTAFSRVEIPYAYKLMSQELQAINVVPRIMVE